MATACTPPQWLEGRGGNQVGLPISASGGWAARGITAHRVRHELSGSKLQFAPEGADRRIPVACGPARLSMGAGQTGHHSQTAAGLMGAPPAPTPGGRRGESGELKEWRRPAALFPTTARPAVPDETAPLSSGPLDRPLKRQHVMMCSVPDRDGTPTAFQRQVAHLYRLTGASVEHDRDLGGNQVDVWVVERTTAGTEVRLVVECKDLTEPTGVGHVNALATKMDLLRSKSLADVGVLVSRSDFTRPARRAAATHGIRLVMFDDLQYVVQAPTRVVLEDVRNAIDQARRLSGNFKEALRSPERLSSFEVDGLNAEITKALREYQLILDRHRIVPPGNADARRALGSVARLEDATDQTLDALYYFRRVDEAISEANNGLPPAGRSEADYAAANSVRLRDLEQARSQLRFRLRRLEETCDRLMPD